MSTQHPAGLPAEPHVLLTSGLQGTLGNEVVQSALLGDSEGYGPLLTGALALGTAGVSVAGSAAELMDNGRMQAVLRASALGREATRADGVGPPGRPGVRDRLDVALTRGGSPLPQALAERLEAVLGGVDLRLARIHTDAAAARAAEGVQARAFTVGEDVYFGDGEYRPHTPEGLQLLAHELTHVRQSQQGRVGHAAATGEHLDGVAVSAPTDPLEREAERAAASVSVALAPMTGGVEQTAPASPEAAAEGAGGLGAAPGAPLLRQVTPQGPGMGAGQGSGGGASPGGDKLSAGHWYDIDRLTWGAGRSAQQAPADAKQNGQGCPEEVGAAVGNTVLVVGATALASVTPPWVKGVAGLALSMTSPHQPKERAEPQHISGGEYAAPTRTIPDPSRWEAACLHNLRTGDSAPFAKIEHRRDFYFWFYDRMVAQGCDVRWPLAAGIVANGAGQLAHPSELQKDVGDGLGATSDAVRQAMELGNMMIFEDVFPKLRDLNERVENGEVITGDAAGEWDAQTLAAEQQLVQPLYESMSEDTQERLEDISKLSILPQLGLLLEPGANNVPAGPANLGSCSTTPFPSGADLSDPEQRWRYGIQLAKTYGQDKTRVGGESDYATPSTMPTPAGKYLDGSEYKRLLKLFEERTGQKVQLKSKGGSPKVAPRAPRTPSQALPAALAAALATKLGDAVSLIRVHAGPEDAEFARILRADAVTIGLDIYFGAGRYRPGSEEGDKLIAHEAHHAVLGGRGEGVSQPSDPSEREAEAFEDEVDGILACGSSEGSGDENPADSLKHLSIQELQAIVDDSARTDQERETARALLDVRRGGPLGKDSMIVLGFDVRLPEEPSAPEPKVKPVSDAEFFRHLPPELAQHYMEIRQSWRMDPDGVNAFPYKDHKGDTQWKRMLPGPDGKPLSYSEAYQKFHQSAADGDLQGTPIKPQVPVGAGRLSNSQSAAEEELTSQDYWKRRLPQVDTSVSLVEGSITLASYSGGDQDQDGDGIKGPNGGAELRLDYRVGPGNAEASLGGEASAKLVELDKTWSWESPAVTFMGEEFGGEYFVFVKGMVGAEVEAKIYANARWMQQGGTADPERLLKGTGLSTGSGGASEGSGSGGEVGWSTSAFVGARVQVGAGGSFDWHQKDAAHYAPILEHAGPTIVALATVAQPGLGWILQQSGAGAALSKLMQTQLDWSEQRLELLGVQAVLTGSLGAGKELGMELALKGGAVTFRARAGATFGLGAGVAVDISIGAINGAKFALVAIGRGGELAAHLHSLVKDWITRNAQALAEAAMDIRDLFVDWLEADDKIREAVACLAHECAPSEVRGQWIKTLSAGWCADEDEAAIVEILRFSQTHGDLAAVLSAGLSAEELLDELSGAHAEAASALLGGSELHHADR